MTRRMVFAAILAFAVGIAGSAQTATVSPLSLSIVPSFTLPFWGSPEFTYGGGGTLLGEYRMPFLPLLFVGAEAGFSYVPLTSITTMSLASGGVVVGTRFDFMKSLSFSVTAAGGYFYASLNDGSGSGSNPFASLGTEFSWTPVPAFSIGLGATYRDFFGLYNDIAVTLGASYNFMQ